jgi:copper homeostasis protein
MQELMQVTEGMSVTLHRAFDMCRNPFQTLEEAIQLGVNTILTSGQKQTAWEGRELLEKLIKLADGRIDIMAGAGVSANVIEQLVFVTGGSSYHMSGKITKDSSMKYRKADVSMGLTSLSEYEIWQTSETSVKAAKEVLEKV